MIGEDEIYDDKCLSDFIRKLKIEHIKITPTHLQVLLNGNGFEIKKLKSLIAGGETIWSKFIKQDVTRH